MKFSEGMSQLLSSAHSARYLLERNQPIETILYFPTIHSICLIKSAFIRLYLCKKNKPRSQTSHSTSSITVQIKHGFYLRGLCLYRRTYSHSSSDLFCHLARKSLHPKMMKPLKNSFLPSRSLPSMS